MVQLIVDTDNITDEIKELLREYIPEFRSNEDIDPVAVMI